MSLCVDYAYDEEEHYAPPIRIQWVTRAKSSSHERWIFVQCCGQMGRIVRRGEEQLITSLYRCKGRQFSSNVEVTEHHHSGKLILMRTSYSQIVKHTPPLAQWNCCGAAIPRWDDSWDSRDKKIPFRRVDTGCKEGRYPNTGSVYSSSEDREIALCAKPLIRKPKAPTKSSNKSSGPSSGEQTVVTQVNKLMNPEQIKFTQASVLKTFSDSSKPSLLTAMQQIFDGYLNIEDFPRIRIASRGNKESPGYFYTCDNRRLLLFKIRRVKEVSVKWIQWTSEFDAKLCQNIRFHPQTRVMANTEGINAFRKVFVKLLFETSAENHDHSLLYIPKETVGYVIGTQGRTKEIISHKYATHVKIRPLPIQHHASALTDVVKISYREDLNAENEFVAGNTRKEHVKMVRKLLSRNESS